MHENGVVASNVKQIGHLNIPEYTGPSGHKGAR